MDPNPKLSAKPMTDLDQMAETPTRRTHHRRAQSETFFRFSVDDDDDDDILLDDVVGDLDLSTLDDLPIPDSVQVKRPSGPPISNNNNNNNSSRLSVDADFFDGLSLVDDDIDHKLPHVSSRTHRHSNSMDASSSIVFDNNAANKALAPDKLAELSLIDPKRAKRILANRQSAARSKERKTRYTNELERKVHTLRNEATTLSAQITLLQHDTTGLTIENKELKLRLQALEQQAHLRDALNERLREEVQRLKIETGQAPAANGNSFNRALQPQFSAHPQSYHFGNHQAQQFQQQQLQMPGSASHSTQARSGQPQPSFADFN